jgi:hypothetical protein
MSSWGEGRRKGRGIGVPPWAWWLGGEENAARHRVSPVKRGLDKGGKERMAQTKEN